LFLAEVAGQELLALEAALEECYLMILFHKR
jgi:hypothetical protein